MTIKDDDYNKAKAILVKAGCKSASKSHNKHNTKGGVDDGHGQSLLSEARDEFQAMDKKETIFKAKMTKDHYEAIHSAAKKMGITKW